MAVFSAPYKTETVSLAKIHDQPRAAELVGYTQAELCGKLIESLVPERFRERHPSHRDNLRHD